MFYRIFGFNFFAKKKFLNAGNRFGSLVYLLFKFCYVNVQTVVVIIYVPITSNCLFHIKIYFIFFVTVTCFCCKQPLSADL